MPLKRFGEADSRLVQSRNVSHVLMHLISKATNTMLDLNAARDIAKNDDTKSENVGISPTVCAYPLSLDHSHEGPADSSVEPKARDGNANRCHRSSLSCGYG